MRAIVRSLKLGSLGVTSLFVSGALAQTEPVAGVAPTPAPVPITVLASSPKTERGLIFLT